MSARVILVLVFVFLVVPWTPTSAGEIHEAVVTGEMDRVVDLLKENPGLIHVPDETDESKSLPLHLAA